MSIIQQSFVQACIKIKPFIILASVDVRRMFYFRPDHPSHVGDGMKFEKKSKTQIWHYLISNGFWPDIE